jgi:hypothetical protein
MARVVSNGNSSNVPDADARPTASAFDESGCSAPAGSPSTRGTQPRAEDVPRSSATVGIVYIPLSVSTSRVIAMSSGADLGNDTIVGMILETKIRLRSDPVGSAAVAEKSKVVDAITTLRGPTLHHAHDHVPQLNEGEGTEEVVVLGRASCAARWNGSAPYSGGRGRGATRPGWINSRLWSSWWSSFCRWSRLGRPGRFQWLR